MFFGKVNVKEDSDLHWHEIVYSLLVKSYSLKDIIKTDNDRRKILKAKYELSKHTLISLILDYVADSESERWYWNDPLGVNRYYGNERYHFTDMDNDVDFCVRCFNSKPDNYYAGGIKIYINNKDNLLSDDENVIMLQVMRGSNEVRRNLVNLKIQQGEIKDRNAIKDLYK